MTTARKVGGGAAVIAVLVAFTPVWEGTDLVAKKDMIGTGHPLTYCEGLTDVDGKVKNGQRFTPAQCNVLFAKALPKYLVPIQKCVTREVPVKTMAALVDAAYNAGPAAICGQGKPGQKGYRPMSPMVARMNAGDLTGGCKAFQGWFIRSDGQVRKGLVARRSGLPGDKRKNEMQLCLEGVKEGIAKPEKITLWTKITLLFHTVRKG